MLPAIFLLLVNIHDFHNGRRSRGPGNTSMKKRSERPRSVAFVYCSMAFSSSSLQSNSSNAILLTEDDIPGASLLGQKQEELKTTEFQFKLKLSL